ncbi:MAG: YfhO family protein [Lachnospiraceae bacterium]|nr:YfhO family protein [Lachnospiraceae bacterium]
MAAKIQGSKDKYKFNMMIQKHSAGCMAFLSFFLPAWILFSAFYISAVFPFGDSTFMRSDMAAQYVPFFAEFMRKLRSGEGLFYSWNIGLGTNFWALYGYYLASPFYWFGILVPEEYYVEFVSYLVIGKVSFCGLTAYEYLYTREKRLYDRSEKGKGTGGRPGESELCRQGLALFFSLGYSMSGFVAAYNWNVMWLDCVALLPVVLMGLEQLVLEDRPFLYWLSLSASILFNFYLSIMICIFLVLYFACLCCERCKGTIIRNFIVYSLLAGGAAAILLVPEACALLQSDYAIAEVGGRPSYYFSILDMLARHCMIVKTELGRPDSFWPNIYCGVFVFLGIPLYAVNNKIAMRRRAVILILVFFLIISFNTAKLDYFWHGMNYTDGLPARESFIYILLVLTICHEGVIRMDFSDRAQQKKILYLYLAVVCMLLFWEKFSTQRDIVQGAIWLSLLFVTVYAAMLYLAVSFYSRDMHKLLLLLSVLAMLVEVHINMQMTSVICEDREDYFINMEAYQTLYGRIRETDRNFYRLEIKEGDYSNNGARIGYPSASVYSSTMNAKVKNMYRQLGMRGSRMFYALEGSTAFTEALMNVRYRLGGADTYEEEWYTVVDTWTGNDGESSVLYQCNAYLPFGYVAPSGWNLEDIGEENGLERQNQLVRDLGIRDPLFEPCHTESTGEKSSQIICDKDGIYYGVIQNDSVRDVYVSGGAMSQGAIYLKKGLVFKVGNLHKGQSANVTIQSLTSDSALQLNETWMRGYRLNGSVLEEAFSILSRQHLENVTYDSTHINGDISLDSAGRLILSVPYEKGWQIRLNGERVEPATFGGALIALDLQPGTYHLEMKYVPYGFEMGLGISIASLVIVLVFWRQRRCKERIAS